ncbi:conserved hypothetical protein [Ricinus communis]|uniref:Uncharacterized protein n=1 Tax=Ricinus communis TaxID=3988 RepID=B9RHV7_RICCO|nr:conserved hypothetical protein [Ricinus communis]
MSSGPLCSSKTRKVLGSLESMGSGKINSFSITHNPVVTTLGQDDEYTFWKKLPKDSITLSHYSLWICIGKEELSHNSFLVILILTLELQEWAISLSLQAWSILLAS